MFLLEIIEYVLLHFWKLCSISLSHSPTYIFQELIMLALGIGISFLLSYPIKEKTKLDFVTFFVLTPIIFLIYSLSMIYNLQGKSFIIGFFLIGFFSTEFSTKYKTKNRVITSLRLIEFCISILGFFTGLVLSAKFGFASSIIQLLISLLLYKLYHYCAHFAIAIFWNILSVINSGFPSYTDIGEIFYEQKFREILLRYFSTEENISTIENRFLVLYKKHPKIIVDLINKELPQYSIENIDILIKKQFVRIENRINNLQIEIDKKLDVENIKSRFHLLQLKHKIGLSIYMSNEFKALDIDKISIEQKNDILVNGTSHIIEIEKVLRNFRFFVSKNSLGIKEFLKIAYPNKTISSLTYTQIRNIMNNSVSDIKNYQRISKKYSEISSKYPNGIKTYLLKEFNIDSNLKVPLQIKEIIGSKGIEEISKFEGVFSKFKYLERKYKQGFDFILDKHFYSKTSNLTFEFCSDFIASYYEDVITHDKKIKNESKNAENLKILENIQNNYSNGLVEFLKIQHIENDLKSLSPSDIEVITSNKFLIIELDNSFYCSKFEEIKSKNPRGLRYYLRKNSISPEQSYKEILQNETQIEKFEKDFILLDRYKCLKKLHDDFNSIVINLFNESLFGWEIESIGDYHLEKPILSIKEINIGVLDTRIFKMSLYKLPAYKNELNNLFEATVSQYHLIKNKKESLSNSYYQQIKVVSDSLASPSDKLGIVLIGDDEVENNLDYHYRLLLNSVIPNNAILCRFNKGAIVGYNKRLQTAPTKYLILSLTYEIDLIKKIITGLIHKNHENRIVVMSVFNILSKEQTAELINRKQKEIEENQRIKKEIEEHNRIQEFEKQQKLLKEKRLLEEAREKERLRIIEWNDLNNFLIHKVSSYEAILMKENKIVHHYYFHDYIPTTIKNVPRFIWDIRNKVWDFKDGKENISRQIASDVALLLKRIFTNQELSKFVFICAPASKIEVNIKRFKSFSENVCAQTGMMNGFEQIKIHKERESIHTSGKSSHNPMDYITLNENFFHEKRIILFDDVVTRGRTMRYLSLKLEELGSKVIFVISIAKTKYE